MWIERDKFSALVSAQGGSVLQLQWQDKLILGPARMIRSGGKLKRRGASHWCFPNFGIPPKDLEYFPKHGYLRDIVVAPKVWSDRGVSFETSERDLKISTICTLWPSQLDVGLFVENLGKCVLPILPAFHPYFAVPEHGLRVTMGGKLLCHTDGARGVDGISAKARVHERGQNLPIYIELIGIGTIKMDPGINCRDVVIWSDEPSQYACVEPVFGRVGTFGMPEGQSLKPGGKIDCNVIFELIR